MSDMKCPIKCPICGKMLQKYGEVDPDTGVSIVLGANCPKCNIGNSDIKLWQELICTRKAVDLAIRGLEKVHRANSCITKESQIAYEYLKEIKQLIKGE